MKHDVHCRRCGCRTRVRFDDSYCTEFDCHCGRSGVMLFDYDAKRWVVTSGFRPVGAMERVERRPDSVGRGIASRTDTHPLEAGDR